MSLRPYRSLSFVLATVLCGLLGASRAEAASWAQAEVGTVAVAGSATISSTGTYKVLGEGNDIGSTSDSFHYLYQPLVADGTFVARVASLTNTNTLAKAGIMFRQSLAANALEASLLVTPSSGIGFERRTAVGGSTTLSVVSGTAPEWVRLIRSGTTISAAISQDGTNWAVVRTVTVPFSGTIYVGFAVASHAPSRLTTAYFDHVSLSTTAIAPTTGTGLVGAWSFDEGSGTVAHDQLGAGNGTIAGATWSTTGAFGRSLVFNGANSLVTVADRAALDVTRMTLEAWVYPTSVTGARNVLGKERTGGTAYSLYANSTSSRPAGAITTTGGSTSAIGSSQLKLNTWSHVATTYDGNVLRMYVNGVQVGYRSYRGSLMQSTGALRIGGTAALGEYFSGAIDNVRVYNRALSANEVKMNMSVPVDLPAAAAPAPTQSDTTAPSVSVTSPASASTVSGTVTVSAVASDNVGVTSVQLYLNGSTLGAPLAAAPYSVSWDTTNVANGMYSLTAVARDAAGNTATSAAVTVTVKNADTTDPLVAVTSPASGANVSGTVTVAATASDNVGVTSVQLLVNGANLGAALTTAPYATSWDTTKVADGSYTLTAIARDAAGNTTTSAAVTVTVSNADTKAPTVAVTSPASGATVSGSVSLTASAADNVGVKTVQFLVNGQAYGSPVAATPYAVLWDTTAVSNGSYTIAAIAKDAAGNAATSSSVTVNVNNADTKAPVVAVTSPTTGSTLSGVAALTATATDNIGVKSVQFFVNGQAVGSALTAAPYAAVWDTTAVANGTYTVTAVAKDAAGNSATASAVSVTVSNVVVAPQAPRLVEFDSPDNMTILADGQAAITTYTLEVWQAGATPGVSQVYKLLNIGKPNSTSTSISVDESAFFSTLAPGQYFTTVIAVGPGGNSRSAASAVFTIQ